MKIILIYFYKITEKENAKIFCICTKSYDCFIIVSLDILVDIYWRHFKSQYKPLYFTTYYYFIYFIYLIYFIA